MKKAGKMRKKRSSYKISNPNKTRFRIARKFAQNLAKRLGENLTAVFAAGSTASNLANRDSDVDIVVIVEEKAHNSALPKRMEESTQETKKYPGFRKTKMKIHAATMKKHEFEQRKASVTTSVSAQLLLRKGALPVYGNKKYLEIHKACYKKPKMESVKKNLERIREKTVGNYMNSRLKRKNNIKRFLAR